MHTKEIVNILESEAASALWRSNRFAFDEIPVRFAIQGVNRALSSHADRITQIGPDPKKLEQLIFTVT